MRFPRQVLKHILIVTAALFLLLGVPFLSSDYFAEQITGDPDAVSGASLILDAPSGEFVVLLNRNLHTDEEKMAQWLDFFEGREVSFILEDIVCCVGKDDAAGFEMARSFQSRLPQNQMQLRREDTTLMLSKAEHGRFDVILLSREAADAYDIQSLREDEAIEIGMIR